MEAMVSSLAGPSCLTIHVIGILRPSRPTASSKKFVAITAAAGSRSCKCIDMHNELVPYADAWSWQQKVVSMRHSMIQKDDDSSDMILVLQHPPVYTLGTSSSEEFLKFDKCDSPYEIYRTERGGEVTYHGPGQLVMYPILNLRHHKMDLHWYLRSLEEVIMRTLASTFSIKASRIQGLTGVWAGDKKVAAIGIRVSRWITYHGFAVNVTTDLTPFDHIIPCGIHDSGVGSVKDLIGPSGGSKLEDALLVDKVYKSLIKEFSEVFQLSISCTSHMNLIMEDYSNNGNCTSH